MTNIEKQSEIDNLYDLLDAYSKVSHLVSFGEIVSKTHEAISLLEDNEDIERNELGLIDIAEKIEFKVGDYVYDIHYHGSRGCISDINCGRAFVNWDEWSIADSWEDFKDLEIEPEGGF
jgi:hypothetical protein